MTERWIAGLTLGLLVPAAVVVCLTGPVLARTWRDGWPRWLVAKTALTAAVVVLAGAGLVVHVSNPAVYTVARWVGVAGLVAALLLSVLKPAGRRATRGGRHALR